MLYIDYNFSLNIHKALQKGLYNFDQTVLFWGETKLQGHVRHYID